ncbi:IucA/IucC family protein [Nonomuraea sp. JJY05]|uniref:IucA/IucC family protein n=1 Tax=Nonomuraea sp. JJY05 TaxID=3350255 RepID=UPI00373F79CA
MRRWEAEFAADLSLVRPDLSAAYLAALPDARAAVLGRLWRSLLHEPLPGLAGRRGQARVALADGRVLTGRAREPYDLGGEPALWLDGHPHTHPAELLAALGLPGTAGLVEDLDNSVASLALSRAEPARVPATPEEYEQSVVDGHPYHPGCRSRPGVSVAEQLAYMPEHRAVVHLDLLALPAANCLVSGPWPAALTDGDRLLLPVHPWQSAHVLPALGLRPHVTAAVPARPLMSVRTLAPLDGGPHVKTAFSTRMTSGVRDISPGSVRDCVHLSDLLSTLSARLGGRLGIARYLAGAAGKVDGEHSPDVSAMLREPAGGAIPVGAVTRATVRDPAAWLAAFARLVWRDTLGLLALGVALEAHGQNLLVELDRDGLPCRLVYRDLADVRISPARLARHGIEVPPVSARLLTDDPGTLHAKLFGGLVGTTFGSLIALFCQGDRAAESRLWDLVAAAARDASGELVCAEDRGVLFGPHLTVKAHLLSRLEGAPPGDSWTRLPNPLGA